MTYKRFVSTKVSKFQDGSEEVKLTQWMTATKLRLLRVLRSQLVSDAVQQLNVALLRVLFQCRYKGPRHCPGCFTPD